MPFNRLAISGPFRETKALASEIEPTSKIIMIGVITKAKIIKDACTASVQLTAKKPPIHT